jgi:hypothetical protein
LAVADIPEAIPPSYKYALGTIGATFAIGMAQVAFAAFLVLPLILNVAITSMCFSFPLLAAGTVSDGLMMAVYAVMTLIMTGCFFGENFQATAPICSGIIGVITMVVLSNLPYVRDGYSVTVTQENVQNVDEIADWVRAALSVACELADQAPNCWEDQFPTVADGYMTVELPAAAGDFAGQTAYLSASPDDSSITVNVPGGMWVVTGQWTWRGLDNPLALNRNYLIAICWGCACVILGIFLPPVRTSRSVLSKSLVPSILSVTAQSDSLELVNKNRDRLLHGLSSMNGGSAADRTTFEPRIFTAPFEYTVPLLKDLLVKTEQAVLASCCLLLWNKDTGESDEKTSDLHAGLSVLTACANALVSSDGAATESLKELKAEQRPTSLQEALNPPNYLRSRCENVLDATIAWLDALNYPEQPRPCSKETGKNLLHTYRPWVLVHLCTIQRMAIVLTLPFRPKTWNWRDTIWSLKYTLGCIAVFAASVYWDKYSVYAIETAGGSSGANFSGWQMLAYTFTFTSTMECTVKKGILRGVGTVLGGFMAWLGVIVCSWSYDDEATINPYGFIAWLTIITGIAGYFAVEPGNAAHMGAGYDHGFGLLYFVTTMAYIGLYIYCGKGTKNAITANRVVANLLGIVLAMIVAAIPPSQKGNDPNHAVEYWMASRDSFVRLLYALLNDEERGSFKNDDFKESFLKDASFKRRNAVYLFKNAGGLKAFPFLQVDERLLPLMESMSASESLLANLLEIAAEIVGGDDVNDFTAGSEAHHEVLQLLRACGVQEEDDGDDGQAGTMEDPGQQSGAQGLTSTFLNIARTISQRLHMHEAALKEISSQKPNLAPSCVPP